MSGWRPTFFSLAAIAVCSVHAQILPPLPGQNIVATNSILPPLPQLQAPSPVNFFRQLLSMSPAERNRALQNRSPEIRARIQAKIHEYLALTPDDRELRLRATELRWYLTPLFHAAPDERATRLAQVPDELRGIIQARLQQWDLLPPALQKEFLDSDHAVNYFAHVEANHTTTNHSELSKISEQFNQFFEFTADEKTQTLGTLSAGERAQMEKTLETFAHLPVQQRQQCVKNFATFASMAPAQRIEFLKNAEHWAQMSPQERQSWRDLVAHVPLWPPLPPPVIPQNLIPPASVKTPRSGVATN